MGALAALEGRLLVKAILRPLVLGVFLGWLVLLAWIQPGASPQESAIIQIQASISALCAAVVLLPLLATPDDRRLRIRERFHHLLGIPGSLCLLATFLGWAVGACLLAALWLPAVILLPVPGPSPPEATLWVVLGLQALLYGLPWLALALLGRGLGLGQGEGALLVLVLLASSHGLLGLPPLPYDAMALHPGAGDPMRPALEGVLALKATLSTAGGLGLAVGLARLRMS